MAADPERYAWLTGSALEVAGCVTVIAGGDPPAIEAAFGAEADAPIGSHEDDVWARFLHGDSNTVVVEDNGFQGARAEVLGPASRGSAKAASICWNVNGLVQFTWASRGRRAETINLVGLEESEVDQLPRSLRSLGRRCLEDATDSEGQVLPDPVAVGAAMVEAFTGADFGPDSLTAGQVRRLVPVASKLDEAGPWMLREEPQLRAQIEALTPEDQRALATWVARAAIAEAAMQDEPAVAAMLTQLLEGRGTAVAAPGLDALAARLSRESEARYHAALEDEDLHHDLQGKYASQRGQAVYLARHLAHPDPLGAALASVSAAGTIYQLSTLARRDIFHEDERGRELVGHEPNPRRQEFLDIVKSLVVAPRSDWELLRSRLPIPFTDAERAQAVRRDQERRDQGDFAEYQLSAAADESDADDWA